MNLLKTKELGNTGMQITRIGFGSWAVGGEWAFGWGPQDDSESIKAIRRALELGVSFQPGRGVSFDGSAVPGLRLGFSEAELAKKTREMP